MVRIKLVEIKMSSEPVDSHYQKYCQSHAQHAREQQRAWKYEVKRNYSDLEICPTWSEGASLSELHQTNIFAEVVESGALVWQF